MNVGKIKAIEAFIGLVDALYELRKDYIKSPTSVAETGLLRKLRPPKTKTKDPKTKTRKRRPEN